MPDILTGTDNAVPAVDNVSANMAQSLSQLLNKPGEAQPATWANFEGNKTLIQNGALPDMQLTYTDTDHAVQKGESLWKIAEHSLEEAPGSGKASNADIQAQVKSIIEANKDQNPDLVSNPNLIHEGMILHVPTPGDMPVSISSGSSSDTAPAGISATDSASTVAIQTQDTPALSPSDTPGSGSAGSSSDSPPAGISATDNTSALIIQTQDTPSLAPSDTQQSDSHLPAGSGNSDSQVADAPAADKGDASATTDNGDSPSKATEDAARSITNVINDRSSGGQWADNVADAMSSALKAGVPLDDLVKDINKDMKAGKSGIMPPNPLQIETNDDGSKSLMLKQSFIGGQQFVLDGQDVKAGYALR